MRANCWSGGRWPRGLREGGSYGVRILSERVAITSADGVGRIERYVYCDATGKVKIEYPRHRHRKRPVAHDSVRAVVSARAAYDATYDGGFASAGTFLGHVLVRVPRFDEAGPAEFSIGRRPQLRNDLIIGPNGLHREDPKAPAKEEKYRPCTRDEVEAQMAAGMNSFGPAMTSS